MKSLGYASLLTLLLVPGNVASEEIRGFDPTRSCIEVLSNTGGTTDQFMIAAWVFGYLAAQNEMVRTVDIGQSQIVLGNIAKACTDSGGKSLLELVAANKPVKSPDVDTGPAAGSEAEARALLMKFMEPSADRHALTWALVPSHEDVRAVYAEPLASKMIATYDEHLTRSVAIGPKPGQSNLLTWYATTDALKTGSPMLEEFPGGYRDVVGFF